MGQTSPGDSAIIFAPAKISLPDRREPKLAFSPNNMVCLISNGQNSTFQILHTNFYSGYWKTPVPAYFISNVRPIEPFYYPDILHVFLTGNADIFMSSIANNL